MLRKIADSWLKNGIEDGVGSWDRHLMKRLTPIMMSAFSSRVGGVLRSYQVIANLVCIRNLVG
jgi:hypothetical protein